MMQPYVVLSPEYGEKVPVTDDGDGPGDYGCDVAEVEAWTKREAVILGVRKILAEQSRSWAETNRSDGQSPFAGYRAELARCGHGNPHFLIVDGSAVYLRCWACAEQGEVAGQGTA